jgi:Cu+-exporting ATPase
LLAPYAPPARKKEKKISFFEIRVLCSFAFLIPLFYIAMGKMLGFPLPAALYDPKTSAILQMLLLLPILLLNFGYFKRGYANLIKAHPNMDSLIALGTTASLGFSLYGAFVLLFKGETQVHLYFDSAGMILTLITLGKYLEARSKKKTGKAIADLLTLTPEDATVFKNGKWQTVL